jgi:dihydroxyacetone kinase-like protein
MMLFTKKHLIEAVNQISLLMQENRDYLIELDSAIGDGDLGLTMTKGFSAAVEAARLCEEDDLGIMLKRIGFAIAKAAPSTMGTLTATAFMGAGKALEGVSSMNAAQIALFFRSMAEVISARGKAKEGDKTLLDVLFPVARALEANESPNICAQLSKAVEVAKHSLEATRLMVNQHGKAAVFREKSLGLLDPGAAAVTLMIEGFQSVCLTDP